MRQECLQPRFFLQTAISYRHTKEIRYLEAARRLAAYFCAEVARNGYIPPVDFRAPAEPVKIDASAGTIAACGLLSLAETAKGETRYETEAVRILQAIEAAHCDWNPATDGLVRMATAQYHGKTDELQIPLIYGDYFFLEALSRLRGSSLQIW